MKKVLKVKMQENEWGIGRNNLGSGIINLWKHDIKL